MSEKTFIGKVVGGGLKESLQVRLEVPAEQVQEGAFVVIESGDWLFHGLVTDLQLGSTDPRFADEPIDTRISKYLAEQLYGQTLYTNAQVLPALMMERGPEPDRPAYKQWRAAIEAGLKEEPSAIPVKTIPPHHAQVRLAQPGDIAEIFGSAGERGNFVIGYTREQGHPVVINMEKFVQRSSGVFGATGTGKSFLTRMVLAGLIHYDKASVLVFDMHNEYGLNDTASDTGKTVTGLRTKFGSKVQVVGLAAGTMIRGQTPDFHLEIPMSEIMPQDIEMLTRE
ncbi:MAG: helicase HerA domain-containing protein, partial [Anaerolineales bacterium]